MESTQDTLEERYYTVLRKATRSKNGCGCYQTLVVLFVWLGMLSSGVVTSGFTFWLLRPGDTNHHTCKVQGECSGEPTIQNWITHLAIECHPWYVPGLIGASYFLGWAIFSIYLPSRANTIGR